jgi:hypothetical protein
MDVVVPRGTFVLVVTKELKRDHVSTCLLLSTVVSTVL